MPSKVPPQEVKTQAISEATAAIKTVKDLGFVEFTAGLIHGSFDAIIDATIKQMKAYSDLVADLAKTLTQFEAERVSPADVTLYLAKSYPDGAGGTSVNSGYKFKKKPAKPNAGYAGETAKEQLNKVGQALVLETSGLADAYKISFDPLTHATGTDDEASFTQAFVLDVYPKISKLLAKTMIEHLRAMAREGMARIVVTDGELLTKLTFRVEATEIEAKQTSDYHQDGFSLNFGAGFKSARFRASLGIGYSSINCSSVNTQNFDAANMSAEIIGQVRIKFHTQTFAPIIKDEPIA
jgi:hypothetical protein